MSPSTENYSFLIRKIDEFIRKYYLNRVVRGSLYLSASLFISYILVTVTEFYGNFNELIRSLLFYGFLFFNLFIFLQFILIPLLSLCRLGKVITHEQAAMIIGKFFAGIDDKLLNALQLKQLADENPANRAFIEAGINQKIEQLRPVPFSSAVKISENRKYLKFALPPLFVILLIGLTAPYIFTEGTERLVHYNRKYVRRAPFSFIVLNKDLSAVEGEDLDLEVKMEGEEIPHDIYIEDGLNSYKLEKESVVKFHYAFRNLQRSRQIRFLANGFYSVPYLISVKKKPALLDFSVRAVYPAYLRKSTETIKNTGDLTVPEGTKLFWNFKTKNSTILTIKGNAVKKVLAPSSGNTFFWSLFALKSTGIEIRPGNHDAGNQEPVFYNLNVIPDRYPSINVSETRDSLKRGQTYFRGLVADDYGFSSLKFRYRITERDKKRSFKSRTVQLTGGAPQSSFFYALNVSEVGLLPGEHLEYFLEVYDNDGVNGPKSSKSPLMTYNAPTKDETEKQIEQNSAGIKQKMQEAMKQAARIESQAARLNQDLLNKKSLSFEEKQQIKDLLQKQKDLENMINETGKENIKNLYDRRELYNEKKEIAEKQKQIDDLFRNVLDDKTKEILLNLQKLLDQNNKILTREELSRMQMDNKSLHKELDRILELYKQLEFEQNLAAAIEKLNKLSDGQLQLSKQTKENTGKPEQLLEQQQKLTDEFAKLGEEMNELGKKNEELEKRNNFENPRNEQQQIEQLQKQSSGNLTSGNNKKAASSMEKASSGMKQLSQRLSHMQEEEEQAETRINLQNLRQILANLLRCSFSQEKLMLDFKNISINDPAYVQLTRKQKDIRESLSIVQDSLYSLSRKVPQIQSVVGRETQAIKDHIDKALENLGERRTAEANREQQYAMTSVNNLALMLSEIQDQILKNMQDAKQGNKGSSKSLAQLGKMQQELNRNMQKAREQLQKQGLQEQAIGKGTMSEQMARMARQQQLIREALQEINRESARTGQPRTANLDNLSKEMEQTETDLVNKKIRQETLFRQQEILAKLLEADKAERERETSSERESREGKDFSPVFNRVLESYKKDKQRETELIKTVPASLSLFYQLKVGDYFRHLDSK